MDDIAFTMKVLDDTLDSSDLYLDILNTWVNKFGVKIINYVIEYDKFNNKLHLHGTISVPTGFYRKKLCFSDNVHICFRSVYDNEGWLRYIQKDQMCPPNEICKHEDQCLMMRLTRQRLV